MSWHTFLIGKLNSIGEQYSMSEKINIISTISKKISNNTAIVITILVILIIKYIQYPSLFITPEIIQDGGINFLRLAVEYNIASIIATDAGYMPVLPRVLTILIVNVVPAEYYSYAIQYSALGMIAFFSALILKKEFEIINKYLFVRFLLAIAIASFPSISINYIENFSIYGTVFIIYLFLKFYQDKTYLLKNKILIFFLILIIPSKPYLIITSLFFIYLYLNDIVTKNSLRIKLFFVIFLSYLFQIIVMIWTRVNTSMWQGSSISPIEYLKFDLLSVVDLVEKISYETYLLFILIPILLISYLKDKDNSKTMIITFLFFLSMLLAQFLNLLSMGPNIEIDLTNARHFLFSYIMLLFLISIISTNRFSKTLLSLFFLFLVYNNVINSYDIYSNKKHQYSNWDSYYKLLQNDRYCIPVNTENKNQFWILKKNCEYINANNPYGYDYFNLSDADIQKKVKDFMGIIIINPDKKIKKATIKTDNGQIYKLTEISDKSLNYQYFLLKGKKSNIKVTNVILQTNSNSYTLNNIKAHKVLVIGNSYVDKKRSKLKQLYNRLLNIKGK